MEDRLETCKNCQWWWPNKSQLHKSATLDPRFSDDTHWSCCNDLLSYGVNDHNPSPRGLSSYEYVATGPDFGCIHWQVKLPF
jgi:hypothetical protein